MERYRKISTTQETAKELVIAGDSAAHIKVSSGGKVKNYVSAIAVLIKNGTSDIYISGIGQAINKAVSVAEMIARNHKANLSTTIFEVQEIDTWESINGDLDPIAVTRHLPAILLRATTTTTTAN